MTTYTVFDPNAAAAILQMLDECGPHTRAGGLCAEPVNNPRDVIGFFPFYASAQGESFIASGDSRETSREIMKAIAYLARDLAEAESIWRGDRPEILHHIAEIATQNGRIDPSDLLWGDAGSRWMPQPERED